MSLDGLGPIRALLGEVGKLLASETIDLAEVPRIFLAIVGMHLAVGRAVVIILHKDDGAWRRT